MKWRRFVCVFVCWAGACGAQSLEERIQGSRASGDWASVVEVVKPRAQAGQALYQAALGDMVLHGMAGQPDVQQAHALFLAAAQSGFAPAQSFIGYFHAIGLGVPKDAAQAASWYRKAADQGFAEAQFNLGYMHQMSELPDPTGKLALEWYLKAAEQKFPKAWLNLGVLLLQGKGEVRPDPVRAVNYLKLAANAGVTPAQMNLGLLYLQGNAVTANPALAYYYLLLASSDDSRGRCLPSMLKVASRMEAGLPFSQELIVREEMAASTCMKADARANGLIGQIDKTAEKFPEIKPLLDNARQTAARFLEQRRWLDAPARDRLQAQGKVTPTGEYAFFQTLPHWQFIRMPARDGNILRSEIRPPGQTGATWSKTATYEQVFDQKYPHPAGHLEPRLQGLRANCPGLVTNKVFDAAERGYPTLVMLALCESTVDQQRNELHFFKAVQGDSSFYLWHGIWRGEPGVKDQKPEDLRKIVTEMTGWLKSQVVCDTRVTEGERMCPAGGPRPN
jgi:TPR repeat protein